MNEYEIELLGFYRQRLAECIQLLGACERFVPAEYRGALLDHIAQLKSVCASAERAREAQS